VIYYPGSHNLPEITMEEVGGDGQEYYGNYERHVAHLIERHGLAPQYATIRKGQTFIWASNLLHGGSPQKDKSRTRHSQVTHFFFEGCQYYTPMMSNKERVKWRNPDWISEANIDPRQGYQLDRVRELVAATIPAGEIVLVVSQGDEELIQFDGRRGWHFPQDGTGRPLGYHPADSAEAIAHLEHLRTKGAGYLLLPGPERWWLDHYAEVGRHLKTRHRLLTEDGDCVIFALSTQ
jgi:hypothetical protein